MLEVIASFVGGEIASSIVDRFKNAVIDKWKHFRAKQFFSIFLREVTTYNGTHNNQKLKQILDKIFEDESKTEYLYDTFRKVSITASKETGPRIIAYISAHVILNNRKETEDETKIFMLAESLTDSEYNDFLAFYEEHFTSSDEYIMHRESIASNSHRNSLFLSSNLVEQVGIWAYKLKNLGIIYEDIIDESRPYHEDSERYIDEDGIERIITHKIVATESARFLYETLQAVV
jgi:hypothetical protein